MPELDSDLGPLGVQSLAGLQQEGDPVPAGIVYKACHCCKCWADAALQNNTSMLLCDVIAYVATC